MTEKHIDERESKRIFYEELEEYARGKIRDHLQDLLEQEVSEWLGREKSERKAHRLEQAGYRNGYGKTRRFAMRVGTIEIRRLKEKWQGEYDQWKSTAIEEKEWAYHLGRRDLCEGRDRQGQGGVIGGDRG